VRPGAQNNSTPWWWAWRSEEKQFGWVTGLTLTEEIVSSWPWQRRVNHPDGLRLDRATRTTKVSRSTPKKRSAHRRLHNWCLNYSHLLITLSLWSSPLRSIFGNSTARCLFLLTRSGASQRCMSRDIMNLRRWSRRLLTHTVSEQPPLDWSHGIITTLDWYISKLRAAAAIWLEWICERDVINTKMKEAALCCLMCRLHRFGSRVCNLHRARAQRVAYLHREPHSRGTKLSHFYPFKIGPCSCDFDIKLSVHQWPKSWNIKKAGQPMSRSWAWIMNTFAEKLLSEQIPAPMR